MDHERWDRELCRWAEAAGRAVTLSQRLPSTHEVALGRLENPAALTRRGAWVMAYEQTAGIGRQGRRWASPAGRGVYASWVAAVPRADLATLPLVLAVALCEGLEAFGFSGRLKWPNDLLLDGDKVGGLLIQTRGGGKMAGVVASFGINHGHQPCDLPRPDATSLTLAANGTPLPSLSKLTQRLVERVEAALSGTAIAADVLARYRARSAHSPGDELEIRVGDAAHQGRFLGFSASGQLRLATATGEELFSAGEVSL